jgi:predicted transporter
MNANNLLWAGQILLAVAMLAVGFGHAFTFDRMVTRPGMDWMAAVGRGPMRAIGGLEILGAAGLILPAATGILPWLSGAAAACVVLLMIFAAIFHARRSAEGRNIATNLVIGAFAAFVAYGRFFIAPLS